MTRLPQSHVALTRFAGRAGDHNDRAMIGSAALASALAGCTGATALTVGEPEPALSSDWHTELAAARPSLELMAARYEGILGAGAVPVTALSRCSVALATLPVVARHRPDAVVVWFDAHADLHTPETTTTGYLGGLAFSAPLGLWDSGLGHGVDTDQALLVGARDIDPPEQLLLDLGVVPLVGVGPTIADGLRDQVAGRPVYVHIDCDVLAPGIVPTDYRVPGGLTLEQLHACAEALAESEIVGIEVGEFESDADVLTAIDAANAERLVDALQPLLARSLSAGQGAPILLSTGDRRSGPEGD